MQPECTKRCSACGAEKSLVDFYNRRKSPDGKNAACKPCMVERARQQREKHHDRRVAYNKAYYEANKAVHNEKGRRYQAANRARLNASRKAWTDAHPDHMRRYRQQNKERIRRLVFAHYSGGAPSCACCGEWRYGFLALDHIAGDGNTHRRAVGIRDSLGMARWAIANDFPPMFRVLCHNCNSAIAYYGACPHDAER